MTNTTIVPVGNDKGPLAGEPAPEALEAAYAILDAAEQEPTVSADPAAGTQAAANGDRPAAQTDATEGDAGPSDDAVAGPKETERLLRQAQKEKRQRQEKLQRRATEDAERKQYMAEKKELDDLKAAVKSRGLIAVAESMGWSRDKLAEALLTEGDPGLPPKADALSEVEKLRQELKAEKAARQEELTKKETEDLADQEGYELKQIERAIKADPDRYDLLGRFPEYHQKVFDGMALHFEETGEEVPYEVAADRVERWLEQKFDGSKKLARNPSAPAPRARPNGKPNLSSARQPVAAPAQNKAPSVDDLLDQAMATIRAGGMDRPY